MTIRQDMLREKAREIQPGLERSTDIARKAAAEGRSMTRDEKAIYDAGIDAATPILSALRAARSDAAITEYAQNLFGGSSTAGTKSRRLSFKNMGAGIGNRMITGEIGAKALAPSGAAVLSQAFTEDPVALGRAATGLLDILPVQVQPTAEYAFLRQSTRTNNAAVVADGATKPTSSLGLTRVEQSLAVIAHLSEGIPRYWLVDNAAVEQFVDAELAFGLQKAVEAKVIADINDTSGIQTQAYSTSIAVTLRKALTKLETQGLTPAAICLAPADFEAVELAIASSSAIEYQGIPYEAAQRRLFGVPIATTTSATAGVGHVLAADSVVVDTDAAGVQILWSEASNADDWSKNLIRSRVEGRYGTSVLSPLGVVVADLTA